MARENKRKRDERRFGRPERLADLMMAGGVTWPPWLDADKPHQELWLKRAREFIGLMPHAAVFTIDNVCDYAYGYGWKPERSYSEFPCCIPPYEWMFVEGYAPNGFFGPTRRFGWFIRSTRLTPDNRLADERPEDDLPLNGWYLDLTLCVGDSVPDRAAILGMIAIELCLDEMGRILPKQTCDFPFACCVEPTDENRRKFEELVDPAQALATPLWLALSFINCKGTTIEVEPEPAINRERRKAGLKPFLRYHTINIEPMKKVLRTDGNIEANGLKKALHICRGHFATYSDTFLGRKLEKPITFWKPSHVRGSIKQGVVVSDYNVNPPSQS